ncbi:hypothetical protein E4O75_06540 [Neisseria meningitidis]|nr:hypothetical protein [Neisseria meningitidis]MBG8638021.1 hypothetical protein [Neisseria meningitidis]MBG8664649.1 hypothetical protein [Neisseria meningitidis]MBG8684242.1 hypothetical protein [Neisseria meningitidis]MBG8712745.1 hypothetical protein [Neisseria meningitidis]
MCRPACWNIFYPLNLASRDTVGGRRAANGGIRQTARSRARRIAGCKAPSPGCQRGMFAKVTRPSDGVQCIGLPHYSTLARLSMVQRFLAIRNRLLGPPLPQKRKSGT